MKSVKKPAAKSVSPVAKAPVKKTAAKKAAPKTVAKKAAVKAAPVKKAAPAKKEAPKKAPAKKKAAAVSPEQRYKMIQDAAYFIAERHGFNGDNAYFWSLAEVEIDTNLNG